MIGCQSLMQKSPTDRRTSPFDGRDALNCRIDTRKRPTGIAETSGVPSGSTAREPSRVNRPRVHATRPNKTAAGWRLPLAMAFTRHSTSTTLAATAPAVVDLPVFIIAMLSSFVCETFTIVRYKRRGPLRGVANLPIGRVRSLCRKFKNMARILITDDSPIDQQLAGSLLRNRLNAEVSWAKDGVEALEQVNLHAPIWC